jgi:hypothetical protein
MIAILKASFVLHYAQLLDVIFPDDFSVAAELEARTHRPTF